MPYFTLSTSKVCCLTPLWNLQNLGAVPYFLGYTSMVFRQERALLKVGWCPEPEMGPFNAPVIILTKGWILDVYNNAAECLITFFKGFGW